MGQQCILGLTYINKWRVLNMLYSIKRTIFQVCRMLGRNYVIQEKNLWFDHNFKTIHLKGARSGGKMLYNYKAMLPELDTYGSFQPGSNSSSGKNHLIQLYQLDCFLISPQPLKQKRPAETSANHTNQYRSKQ